MIKIVTYIVVGVAVFLGLGAVGAAFIFNTFISPNLSNILEPVSTVSKPIIEEGQQVVQEGVEQGVQESQTIVSEIIQGNLSALREQIISTFTINPEPETEQAEE